jgi:uncharacterized protein YndB with AHSA1/START domain
MTQATNAATDGRSVSHGSFTIERTYPVPAERVFQAFSEYSQKRAWFAEGEGFTVLDYTLDFQVGGREFCRFRFGDGPDMTLDSIYMDIVPNRRIVFGYSMTAAGEPFSASVSSTELETTPEGTRMLYTEQCAFLDGKDGLEARHEGSIELLEALAKHLEVA